MIAGLESSFYYLSGLSWNKAGPLKPLQEIATESFHQLQMAFAAANLVTLVINSSQLVSEVQKRGLATEKIAAIVAAGTLLGLATRAKRDPAPEGFTEGRSYVQITNDLIHYAHIVTSVALLTLSVHVYSTLLNLLAICYSLYKNRKISWLSMEVPNRQQWDIGTLTYTYSFPRLHQTTNDNCSVCLDTNPDTPFCSKHLLHLECTADLLLNNLSQIKGRNLIKHETEHYTNGAYTHTTTSWSIDVWEDSLPKCPLCKTASGVHYLSARLGSTTPVSVRITGRESTFERGYAAVQAAYSLVQAGVTYLHSREEYIPYVHWNKTAMIPVDLADYAYSVVRLGKVVQEKTAMSAHKVALLILTAAASLLAATLTLAMLYDSKFRGFGTLTADAVWKAPTYVQISQGINASRLIATIALALLSKKERAYALISIAAQSYNLYATATFNWLCFTTTIYSNRSLNYSSVGNVKVTVYALIRNLSGDEQGTVTAALKALGEYAHAVINKASWQAWRDQYHHYWFSISVPKNLIPLSSWLFTSPNLTYLSSKNLVDLRIGSLKFW